jgi:2-C-methyl-D-erythritol 2,4-cyclodiphosphate synthase
VIVDYHLHLRDSEERIAHRADAVEPFVETAAARGVDELGFTEHVYYFRQTRALWNRRYQTERCVYDLDDYVDAIVEAKRRGLPVKLGLEVDYVGERQHELAAILRPYPWDYLLGSVHWIDGLAVDSGPEHGVWAEWPVDEVWGRYFEALAELAGSGHVDVLAHPDLAKIFGLRPERIDYPARRRAVSRLRAAAARRPADHARLRRPRSAERRPRLCPRPGARACGRLRDRDRVRSTRSAPGDARVRVGLGADAHALVEGVPLVLGGVELDSPRGLAGHSDGDVIAHALIDAVLGAAGMGDIGSLFPSGEAEWEGASSLDLLARAYSQVREAGFALANADCVLVGEEPRIAPVREAMQAKLAEAMGVEPARVTVRATTTDRLGFTGRGEGLAALAVALLE